MLLLVPIAAGCDPPGGRVQFADPTGDVAIDQPWVGAPAPWAKAVDISAVSVDLPVGHVRTVLSIHGLDEVEFASTSPGSDVMYIVGWTASGTGHDGEWVTRADFLDHAWWFRAEGPCLRPQPNGACAGADRYIIEDLPGEVDLAAGTVTIWLPFQFFGGIQPDNRLAEFHAGTDLVWPTWPLYAGDRAWTSGASLVLPA